MRRVLRWRTLGVLIACAAITVGLLGAYSYGQAYS
jgi:hypothetical protein